MHFVCGLVDGGIEISKDLQVIYQLLFESTPEELEQFLQSHETSSALGIRFFVDLAKSEFLERRSFSLTKPKDKLSSFTSCDLRSRFPYQEVNHGDRLRLVVPTIRFDLNYLDPNNHVSSLCDLLRGSRGDNEDLVSRKSLRLLSLVGGVGSGKTRGLLEVGFRHCLQTDGLALYISYDSIWMTWPFGAFHCIKDYRKIEADLACRIAFAFYRQVLVPSDSMSVLEWKNFPEMFPTSSWSLEEVTKAI